MAQGPNYKVKFRRRREGKTNYYRRYTYVLNRTDRVVVRLTNKYVIVQFMKFDPKGDVTVAAAHSRELEKFGWKGDENNSTACYLTGYLAGLRAKKSGMTMANADIGLFTPTKGARIFYALKGVIDSGVKVPMGDVGVSNERITGKHVAEYAQKLEQEDPEKYRRLFSRYLARGLDPKDLPSHFKEVLNSIKSGEK
ncbi:50S ribosomal protein L18 [Metallosphaera sp. J1]|uniref:50S ribosomal protein L18 n=1 Tax=Metallosphaera TaxID=41980 RepID=UPI001EE0618D|nr:50S ribosomal protein L18 [Metallosphaera javensis (ex Hofmann et al. 2022)]MCG3107757.1 50S ribosomal protein L18 [Metallosphaera javensis (ex Hofmann et al. 2022)]BCS92092.1 MAG: 50S ribosomal protein L18 [Metallosphaera javensis (ex Sakai et al. 2022)]